MTDAQKYDRKRVKLVNVNLFWRRSSSKSVTYLMASRCLLAENSLILASNEQKEKSLPVFQTEINLLEL